MTTTAELLHEARVRLRGVAQQRLGAEKSSRWRGTRIVPVHSAWHVGVLLLGDDAVFATGEVLRAAEMGRRGYTAEAARALATRRADAVRGGFRDGEVVHLDWLPIDVAAVDAGGASGPLRLRDGVPEVQWSRAGGFMPLAAYLEERLGFLGV